VIWFIFSRESFEQEYNKNREEKISKKNGKNFKEALIFWDKIINSVFVQQKPGLQSDRQSA